MKSTVLIALLMSLTASLVCSQTSKTDNDLYSYARSRKNDLQISTYATAHCIRDVCSNEAGRREFLSVLKCNGITKVYLEVYRAGLVLSPEMLKESILFLKENGFEVVGGIATVPGDDFAKKQEGPLTWCNWQNKKTQDDFKAVIKSVAPLFDTFIVDDFLCTSDTSLESKAAKGAQSWSVYRRALLTRLEQEVIIRPAKEANPSLKIIIKYPQWYDRFHLFGYDVETGPQIFDEVWVGTETRGQYTQRFGFVQPYEGFINYRWISALAGKKIGGAWFDYGDCTSEDFIEQAYQSVLAGARELVLFSAYDILLGHPGNHLLRQKFEQLADLSKMVSKNPVIGTAAYKPPQSDAGGDLYLMDGIGMFGISLVPFSTFPTDAKVILLPTQAAADIDIMMKIESSLKAGARIVVTSGFLANCPDGAKIAKLAGVKWQVTSQPIEASEIIQNGKSTTLKTPLKLETKLDIVDAQSLINAKTDNETVAFLTKNTAGNIYTLNVHTFSEADFAAVGEVLLSPRQLRLYEVPQEAANLVRSVLQISELPIMDAPTRVSMQQLSDGSFVVQNYNQEAVNIKINGLKDQKLKDRFTGKELEFNNNILNISIPARTPIWIGR